MSLTTRQKLGLFLIALSLFAAFGKGCELPNIVPVPTSGPRDVLIVHETATDAPDFSRLANNLRAGPNADYLKSKGHTLKILDKDQVAAPPATLPAVVISAAGKTLATEPLPKTAEAVIELVKKTGG